MKAIVWKKYGPPDVLMLEEVAKPIPLDNEVLIRIYATTVTAGDCEVRSMKLQFPIGLAMRIWLGLRRPRKTTILGTELAGEIETVGKDVKLFEVGDQVFGSTGLGFGAYAEYICLPEESDNGVVAIKPAKMNYKEAATVLFGARDALYFLRQGNIQSGQRILINGAGGSIGTFAVQLAKHFGAEVTAVDSAEKLEMLRSIGADDVIDYTQEDFTKSGKIYDIVFDVVGKAPFSRSRRSLTKKGFYIIANPGAVLMFRGLWTSMTTGKKVIFPPTKGHKPEDIIVIKELVEAGKLRTVIDKTYPLEKTVEAHRYVDTGQKKGNVVITIPART